MKNLPTDLLFHLLEILFERYKVINVFVKQDSNGEIVDDQGADLLRLIKFCVDELNCRIELPF